MWDWLSRSASTVFVLRLSNFPWRSCGSDDSTVFQFWLLEDLRQPVFRCSCRFLLQAVCVVAAISLTFDCFEFLFEFRTSVFQFISIQFVFEICAGSTISLCFDSLSIVLRVSATSLAVIFPVLLLCYLNEYCAGAITSLWFDLFSILVRVLKHDLLHYFRIFWTF